jgi:hypothetical protein
MRRFLLILSFAAALSACGPISVTDPKTGETAKISVDGSSDGASLKVQGENGGYTIGVPKDLPSHLPPYPDAKYIGSFATKADATKERGAVTAGMVAFSAQATAEEVYVFYKNACNSSGFRDVGSAGVEGSLPLEVLKEASFSRGFNNEERVQMTISKGEQGKVDVKIMYTVLLP